MFKTPFWYWTKAVSDEFCEHVVNSQNWAEATKGTVSLNSEDGTYGENKKLRNTDVLFVDPFSPVGCVLQTHVALANSQAGWNFALDNMQDVQLGKYSEGSFYDWHSDNSRPDEKNCVRKVSAVLLLSDPKSHEGGQFEIDGVEMPYQLTCGSLIVFPSLTRHRVTKITKGVRYSAVGWVVGPNYR